MHDVNFYFAKSLNVDSYLFDGSLMTLFPILSTRKSKAELMYTHCLGETFS